MDSLKNKPTKSKLCQSIHSKLILEIRSELKDDLKTGLKLIDSTVNQLAEAKFILKSIEKKLAGFEETCPVCNVSINPVPVVTTKEKEKLEKIDKPLINKKKEVKLDSSSSSSSCSTCSSLISIHRNVKPNDRNKPKHTNSSSPRRSATSSSTKPRRTSPKKSKSKPISKEPVATTTNTNGNSPLTKRPGPASRMFLEKVVIDPEPADPEPITEYSRYKPNQKVSNYLKELPNKYLKLLNNKYIIVLLEDCKKVNEVKKSSTISSVSTKPKTIPKPTSSIKSNRSNRSKTVVKSRSVSPIEIPKSSKTHLSKNVKSRSNSPEPKTRNESPIELKKITMLNESDSEDELLKPPDVKTKPDVKRKFDELLFQKFESKPDPEIVAPKKPRIGPKSKVSKPEINDLKPVTIPNADAIRQKLLDSFRQFQATSMRSTTEVETVAMETGIEIEEKDAVDEFLQNMLSGNEDKTDVVELLKSFGHEDKPNLICFSEGINCKLGEVMGETDEEEDKVIIEDADSDWTLGHFYLIAREGTPLRLMRYEGKYSDDLSPSETDHLFTPLKLNKLTSDTLSNLSNCK